MGLRSLFSRKKKFSESTPEESLVGGTPLVSRVSSTNASRTHIEELELVFKKYDVNGDGKISLEELGSVMENLGQQATEEELQKMMREADKDGDGFIDLNEFIELNTNGIDSVAIQETFKDAFAVFDIDGNGLISVEELQQVMKRLGDRFSLDECRKMISGIDVDGDGLINFEEFKKMMEKGLRFG